MAGKASSTAGVSGDLQRAVESFVGELSKLTGQESMPETVSQPNPVMVMGAMGDVSGGGLIDLQVTVKGTVFDVKVALPDKSTPPLWGFQVTEGTNTTPMAEVVIQGPEVWKVLIGIPQAFAWKSKDGQYGFSLNTLSVQVNRGNPGDLKFTS